MNYRGPSQYRGSVTEAHGLGRSSRRASNDLTIRVDRKGEKHSAVVVECIEDDEIVVKVRCGQKVTVVYTETGN